jgi:hypothetical protein
MTLAEFHNGLRLLHSIDSFEIGDPAWWPAFRGDPVWFFVRADDDRQAIIWVAMEKRMKRC